MTYLKFKFLYFSTYHSIKSFSVIFAILLVAAIVSARTTPGVSILSEFDMMRSSGTIMDAHDSVLGARYVLNKY